MGKKWKPADLLHLGKPVQWSNAVPQITQTHPLQWNAVGAGQTRYTVDADRQWQQAMKMNEIVVAYELVLNDIWSEDFRISLDERILIETALKRRLREVQR